jgi:hypothetical protein
LTGLNWSSERRIHQQHAYEGAAELGDEACRSLGRIRERVRQRTCDCDRRFANEVEAVNQYAAVM